jgi:hypothetical protein
LIDWEGDCRMVEVMYTCVWDVIVCVMHHCMGGVVRKQVERSESSNTACICSVRVSSRVGLRGICGRVRVADMHELSGHIGTS